jgi:hypothetical protein
MAGLHGRPIFPCTVKLCQRKAAVICVLTPLALDVLRAASDTIPALERANITVASVVNFGQGDGACLATVRLSDGQIARLRFEVGSQPQVIENVRIVGLDRAGSSITAAQATHATPSS